MATHLIVASCILDLLFILEAVLPETGHKRRCLFCSWRFPRTPSNDVWNPSLPGSRAQPTSGALLPRNYECRKIRPRLGEKVIPRPHCRNLAALPQLAWAVNHLPRILVKGDKGKKRADPALLGIAFSTRFWCLFHNQRIYTLVMISTRGLCLHLAKPVIPCCAKEIIFADYASFIIHPSNHLLYKPYLMSGHLCKVSGSQNSALI